MHRLIDICRSIVHRAITRMKRLFRTEILVLGDSHATVFSHKLFKATFPKYFFDVVSVGGATVSGLDNPNSKTRALPIFRKALKRSKALTVIVMLGEVDTGFVIWYRAERNNSPVDVMAERAIQNYRQLLNELSNDFRVICISTPLPTIQDGQNWGEIANLRKKVQASQFQRTQLTHTFNQKIKEYCEQINISCVMLDGESLGEDGLVKKELLNSNANDHHYDFDKYAIMIISRLKGVLDHDLGTIGNSS
jgi:hypothetical protein